MRKCFNLLSLPSGLPTDLHDLYGVAFEARYEQYEEMTRSGELKLFKTVKAENLWRKMLGMLFETGHPWMTFKDPCNLRSPQQQGLSSTEAALCRNASLPLPAMPGSDSARCVL